MVKIKLKLLVGLFLGAFVVCGNISAQSNLFNGESLEGWEGSTAYFRVDDGAIIGGSIKNPIDQSYYLCTTKKYENFELTLAAKFNSKDIKVNGGISFRAKRVPESNEVMGYQADIGYIDAGVIAQFSNFTPPDGKGIYPLWGSLVDENRPDTTRYPRPDIFPVVFLKVADKNLVENTIDPKDWTEVYIKANGPDIEIKLNGATTAKYTEKLETPSKGCICLQTHAGEPFEVLYKNIVIKQL